jgi:CspA family cold shock protein
LPAGVQPGAADALARQETKVPQGTVKWFNTQKGYGFISPADGGDDLFVHITELPAGTTSLADGQAVSYEVGQGRKGPQAVNVRPA